MEYNEVLVYELLNKPLSQENLNKLIDMNSGLVGNELKRFNLIGDDEAKSYGFEALFKAIKTYKKSRGKFSTYATICIRNRLRQLLRERKNRNKLKCISIYTPITIDGNVTLEDSIASPLDTEEFGISSASIQYINKCIKDVLSTYNQGTAKSILLSWIKSNYTYSNIKLANIYNVSQPYVNRVINKFRKKLLEELGGCYL
jgi:RNA polymerase sigma factor (sigma-70 family)